MAEGSQTFEQDIARLITDGIDHARRRPGLRRLAHQPACGACRTTWRRCRARRRSSEEPDTAIFTEITLDVRPTSRRHTRR